MSMNLEEVARQEGLQMASHVWGTTVASQVIAAAPAAGKAIRLRYISVGASSPGSVRLTTGTAAGTAFWVYTGAYPFTEELRSDIDAATGLILSATSGVGNGFIRVYYSVIRATGTTE